MSRGAFAIAVCYLVGFLWYFRPTELLSLTAAQVIPPTSRRTGVWGFIIAPLESQRTSKTFQFDESVVLDWPEFPALGRALGRLLKGRTGEQAFWPFSRETFMQAWVKDGQESGVSVLQPDVYALRHGGASHDLLHQRRTVPEVKMRGRWQSDASVRRYGKLARAMKEENRLLPSTKKYGEQVLAKLNKYLDANGRLCPRPPKNVTVLRKKLLRDGHVQVPSGP